MSQDPDPPRPLSSDEMWMGYQAPLPDYLKSAFDDFSTPPQYPSHRLTYDRLPNAVAAEKHGLRLFKVSARDQIWNLVEMGPELESLAQQQLDKQRSQPADIQALAELVGFDGMRQDANRLFRQGEYMTALWKYVTNWSMYLPYHVDALPQTHPLRAKLGEVEASLFNNISACLVKVAEEARKLGRGDYGNYYMDSAFKTSWVALDLREFAKVRTVYSSAKRSLGLIRQNFEHNASPNVTPANIDTMCLYYAAQVKVLEKVDKDLMFKDLSPEKKLPWPSFDDYWGMGPMSWGTTHGLVQVQKYPRLEAIRAKNKNRPLTEAELWAIWTESVPEPTEPLEYRQSANDYPEFRFTYDKRATGQVYETRCICRAKREFYEVVFRACLDDVSGEAFSTVMAHKKEQSIAGHPWEARHKAAESLKEAGTMHYRSRNIKAALKAYMDAWAELLPFHSESLPMSDWIHTGCGSLEATLWSNISAACIELSKLADEEGRATTLTRLGFMSAYFSWLLREYTTISTVRNSCNRLLSTVPDSSITPPALQPKITALKSLWQQQLESLQGADKGMILAADRQRTVLDPSQGEDYVEVGPQLWIGALEGLKGMKLFS
ncbi:hypothetical protein IAR50_005377 [Cryptococcus sp. DSM 104548]